MSYGVGRNGLIGLVLFVAHVPASSAVRQIILDQEKMEKLVDRRSAILMGRGKIAVSATDSLAALLFNPSLLMDVDGIISEVNTNTIAKEVITYQNLWAFGSKWGNFSIGYSLLDPYENYLRFNQIYDYSLTYSFELVPGIFTGVGFVSDPFRQSMSIGMSVPLKTNIRIGKYLGVYGVVYGASIWNIVLQKNDSLTLPVFATHSLSFSFLNFKYFRAENFLELSVSQDFVRRSFHEAVNLVFFDLLFLSAGMYGNDVMKLSNPTYGTGIDLRRGYTSLKIFYSQERSAGVDNQALSVSFGLRLSGRPAGLLRGENSTGSISPRNTDGLQDVVVFRFRQSRDIQAISWKLVIRNGMGEVVRTIESSKIAPSEKRFRLPAELTWNGRDDYNNLVADDVYSPRFIYIAADYQPYYLNLSEVQVDNSPPSVLATAESDTFRTHYEKESEFAIDLSFQDRAEEDSWNIRIADEAGEDILIHEFSGLDVPDRLRWNLRDRSGRKVPAGRYRISIDARDAAFNVMPPVVIEFSVFYVELNVALQPVRDTMPVTAMYADFLVTTENPHLIGNWIFRVLSGAHDVLLEKRGSGAPGEKLRWNFSESKGVRPADGYYFVYLIVDYAGQRRYESLPARIEIDSVAPEAAITHTPALFSPDGDGIEEDVSFTVTHGEKTPMAEWRLEITEKGEKLPMRTFYGIGNPPSVFRWDGTSDNGELVKSLQSYGYRLIMKDRAGNSNTISGGSINVDFLIFNLGNELRVQTFGLLFDKLQAKMDSEFYSKLDLIILMSKNRLKDFHLIVEGHSDLYGGDHSKEEIAEKRARYVYDYILAKAPELAQRMTYKGYGGRKPVHLDLEPSKQRLNRRVEFYFYRKGDTDPRS
ncbi:MAG: OmpA family protein [Spirochaetota bacterium]